MKGVQGEFTSMVG